jgi:threonine synthase
MKYISTRNSSESLPFENVFIKGLADDGGLFLPEKDCKFDEKDLSKLQSMSYYELATEIIHKFTGDFIEKDNLYELVKKSYSSFRSEEVVKLRKVGNFNILELFHGPTLAFKDIAMQLIGNFYEYYLSKNENFINIIVATSGDTGAAAIDAIKRKKNLNIFVLHPHNRISSVQRRIMCTVKEKSR